MKISELVRENRRLKEQNKEFVTFIRRVGRYVVPGVCNECRDEECDKALASLCNGWRARRLLEKHGYPLKE